MQPAEHSMRPNGESANSNSNYFRDLLNLSETRKAIFIYVLGTGLLVLGGVYAIWRIDLLKRYLADNRSYVLERDARWERHIKGQAAITRLILERLEKPK